jgi:hypothetical protein
MATICMHPPPFLVRYTVYKLETMNGVMQLFIMCILKRGSINDDMFCRAVCVCLGACRPRLHCATLAEGPDRCWPQQPAAVLFGAPLLSPRYTRGVQGRGRHQGLVSSCRCMQTFASYACIVCVHVWHADVCMACRRLACRHADVCIVCMHHVWIYTVP